MNLNARKFVLTIERRRLLSRRTFRCDRNEFRRWSTDLLRKRRNKATERCAIARRFLPEESIASHRFFVRTPVEKVSVEWLRNANRRYQTFVGHRSTSLRRFSVVRPTFVFSTWFVRFDECQAALLIHSVAFPRRNSISEQKMNERQ